MRFLIAGAVLALLAGPALAGPPDLGHPIDGYTYFHRAGETMQSHDQAVDECARQASKAAPPTITPQVTASVIGGAVGGLIAAGQQGQIDGQVFAANLEHCMVIRGWEVREFDMKDGAILTAMDQPHRAALMAQWVGAPTAMGWLDRTYQPVAQLPLHVAGPGTNVKKSLSLLAGVHEIRELMLVNGKPPYQVVEIKTQAAPSAPGAGRALIVVRSIGLTPNQAQLRLVKLDDGPGGDLAGGVASVLEARNPTPLFQKPDPDGHVHVFEVPPGRWRLLGEGPINYCFGGPAFDVAEGEVVFAGTFRSAQPFRADLDLGPARAALAGGDLAARLKPAAYVDGGGFDCGWLPSIYFYALDLKDWLGQAAPPPPKSG